MTGAQVPGRPSMGSLAELWIGQHFRESAGLLVVMTSSDKGKDLRATSSSTTTGANGFLPESLFRESRFRKQRGGPPCHISGQSTRVSTQRSTPRVARRTLCRHELPAHLADYGDPRNRYADRTIRNGFFRMPDQGVPGSRPISTARRKPRWNVTVTMWMTKGPRSRATALIAPQIAGGAGVRFVQLMHAGWESGMAIFFTQLEGSMQRHRRTHRRL